MDEHSTIMTDEDYVRAFRINLSQVDWEINSSFPVNGQKEGDAIVAALRERDMLKEKLSKVRNALEKTKIEGGEGSADLQRLLFRDTERP